MKKTSCKKAKKKKLALCIYFEGSNEGTEIIILRHITYICCNVENN